MILVVRQESLIFQRLSIRKRIEKFIEALGIFSDFPRVTTHESHLFTISHPAKEVSLTLILLLLSGQLLKIHYFSPCSNDNGNIPVGARNESRLILLTIPVFYDTEICIR